MKHIQASDTIGRGDFKKFQISMHNYFLLNTTNRFIQKHVGRRANYKWPSCSPNLVHFRLYKISSLFKMNFTLIGLESSATEGSYVFYLFK